MTDSDSRKVQRQFNRGYAMGAPAAMELFDLLAKDVINSELEEFTKKCNFCGLVLSSVKACDKHEERCKNVPHNKYSNYLDMVNGNELLLKLKQAQGLSMCIEVRRKWNNYTTHEILRPNGDIVVIVDPLYIRLVPRWQETNDYYVKHFGKPLPEFR